MKKLKKIIDLLLKVVELLPILIEFLRALDRDTNVIKTKLDSLNIQVEAMKQVSDEKQQFSELQGPGPEQEQLNK